MAGVGGGEAGHEVDSVGVTACAYHIMHTTTITVYPVLETITSNGCQGPKVGQVIPDPIRDRQVRGVNLSGLSCKHSLHGVLSTPDVDIPHLGA